MNNYGLKITGADELETILPRRCDVIKPQAKRRVEHALRFIADKMRKSVPSYDNVIIVEAELTNTYRGTDDFEFVNNNSGIMITWGKMIW